MLIYAGIGLVSAATILLEIALLRLFAVQQFYHFAFMAISLALLGAGASGSLLSIRRRPYPASLMSLAFWITTLSAYLVINFLPFDSFSIAWDTRQLYYLAVYFLSAAVPFFFAGLIVGGELMAASQGQDNRADGRGSNQVYGVNLIGSAAGALISLPLLSWVGGEGAVILAAVLGALSGVCFSLPDLRVQLVRNRARITLGLASGMVLISLLILILRPDFIDQQLSPYKTLSVLSHAFDANHVSREWDATARMDVIESSTIHIMPGLSLSSPIGVPPQVGLTLDGDNLMPITGIDPTSAEAQQLAAHLPGGLAFELRPDAQTLVLEAGTGMDVLVALAAGSPAITVVEDNALVIDAVKDQYGPFTGGLYDRAQVEVINQSGRVYARQIGLSREGGEDAFDVAIVALTDAHRPVTSGAYSLTEDYLYTVEAFEDYLQTLNDDGLLVVSRWLQTPPSESGRIFGSMVAALQNAGMDARQHLIAFRTLRTMTILASPQPFSETDIDVARNYLARNGFDAVYYPGVQIEDVNQFNLLNEPEYHNLFLNILEDPEGTYENYRFDIRPATDNRPFFYHYFKWSQTPEILASLGLTWQPFGGSGYFVLVALLILVSLASAILIMGPLLIWKGRGVESGQKIDVPNWRLRVLIYFACLGLAYLFIEVPLAQQFILILDQPVTALAIMLFAVLLLSGIGSLTVKRWRLSTGMIILVIGIAIYPLILEPISSLLLGQSQGIRIILAILLIAPLGYLMGLPFAGGLNIVENRQTALVPWAWAINGSFSVISSVLAVMVALSLGFSAVLWLGAASYAVALLVFYKLM
jgi:spermidine synthase